MIPASGRVRGHAAILASAVGFGAGTALSVAALHGLEPADLLAIELGGSGIVVVAVAAATHRLHRRGAGRALAQGAMTPGASFLLGDLGLARTTATSGALLLATEAILTVGLAVLLLGERIGPAAGTALALGVGGTVLVSLGAESAPTVGATLPRGSPVLGNLLVLGSVLCASVFTVWSRRSARQDVGGDSVGVTAWQFLGAIAAVSPFILGTWATVGSRIPTAPSSDLMAAAAVLGCGLVGLLAFNIGIVAVPASRAALLAGVEPVAGALVALVVLGESLWPAQAAGGVLIVAGLAVLTRDRPPPAARSLVDDRTPCAYPDCADQRPDRAA